MKVRAFLVLLPLLLFFSCCRCYCCSFLAALAHKQVQEEIGKHHEKVLHLSANLLRLWIRARVFQRLA